MSPRTVKRDQEELQDAKRYETYVRHYVRSVSSAPLHLLCLSSFVANINDEIYIQCKFFSLLNYFECCKTFIEVSDIYL